MKVLVTGSHGLIGINLCSYLYNLGYEVLGIDNGSKYYTDYRSVPIDIVNDNEQFYKAGKAFAPDYIIALAAIVGTSDYLRDNAYDVLSKNDSILINTFDLAIDLFQSGVLKKIISISSSIVFETLDKYPFAEKDINLCRIPHTVYGFQKLASEFFCKAAYQQYGLKYNIVRPFNCIGVAGIPKNSSLKINIVTDLVNRAIALQPDDKLPIFGNGEQIRYYTDARDIARGIAMVMESDFDNEDFNISSTRRISVKELAAIIWKKIHGTDVCLDYLPSCSDDVLERSPDVTKASKLLGFDTEIELENSIEDIVKWLYAKN